MSYITGFLLPVPAAKKEAYIESARKSWPLFQKYGAIGPESFDHSTGHSCIPWPYHTVRYSAKVK